MASRHKRRYTSAEMTELILTDNDENSDNFSLSSNSSYRDSEEDFEETVLPPSDSDEPCSNVSSSETESDEDGYGFMVIKLLWNTCIYRVTIHIGSKQDGILASSWFIHISTIAKLLSCYFAWSTQVDI